MGLHRNFLRYRGEGGRYPCNARPKRSDAGKQAGRTGATRTMDIKMVGSQPVPCQSQLALSTVVGTKSQRQLCPLKQMLRTTEAKRSPNPAPPSCSQFLGSLFTQLLGSRFTQLLGFLFTQLLPVHTTSGLPVHAASGLSVHTAASCSHKFWALVTQLLGSRFTQPVGSRFTQPLGSLFTQPEGSHPRPL